MFYGAIIRRNAQVFQGTTDRFSYLTGTVLGQVALALGALGLLLVAALVERGDPASFAPLLGAQFAAAADALPASIRRRLGGAPLRRRRLSRSRPRGGSAAVSSRIGCGGRWRRWASYDGPS